MRKRMTVFSISAALLLIAGCSAEPGTGPIGQTSMEAPAVLINEEPGSIRVSGAGIRTTGPEGVMLPFSSPRDAVEAAITAAIGKPQARGPNDECGAGRMESTIYLSGLMLNFQDEYLVGWFVGPLTEPDRVETPEAIRIGSQISDARKVYALQELPDNTLGEEYATDEGIGIFIGEDGAVETFYAGTNCFFR